MVVSDRATRDAGTRLAVAPSPAMEAAVRLDVGTQREHQEDDAGVFPELGLALVADGMGGSSSGDMASRMVLADVPDHLRAWQGRPWRSDQPWSDHPLVTAIKLASLHILEFAEHSLIHRGMGTTVAALLEVSDGVLIAHAGDSRVYRLRARELELLTEDHSLLQECLRRVREGTLGPLTPEQIAEVPRNVITRALGFSETVEVDVRHEPLAPGDLFLLCSDGLPAALDEASIAGRLGEGGDLGAMAEGLIREACERGAPDNIAVVLVRWG